MWRIHRFICIHFRTKSGLFSLAHHPLQAVSMSLASLDCILNGWTCTMRVQRKFETRDCEIYVHSFVWLSLAELFICYTFLCYALVCFCARTFNYRFILLNIATQKATATFCTVSVFWTLVSDQRYVSFWRIAFASIHVKNPLILLFLWIWIWIANFCMRTVYHEKATTTTTKTNGPCPRAFHLSFSFPVK